MSYENWTIAQRVEVAIFGDYQNRAGDFESIAAEVLRMPQTEVDKKLALEKGITPKRKKRGANLKKIWLRDREYGEPLDVLKEVRIDWDNHRHQCVMIKTDEKTPEPLALASALREMAGLLEDEFLAEEI